MTEQKVIFPDNSYRCGIMRYRKKGKSVYAIIENMVNKINTPCMYFFDTKDAAWDFLNKRC